MIRVRRKPHPFDNEMNILEYLRENGIKIQAPCGGRGVCGKCRVRINGADPVKACMTEYRPGMSIEVDDEGDMEILADGGILTYEREDNGRYGIAIDTGTTTIAGVLCDTGSGKVLARKTLINPNTAYGSDVISRIRAAGDGKAADMGEDLRKTIKTIVLKLVQATKAGGITIENQRKAIDIIAISGNTTMIHILMGWNPENLGIYPYKPFSTDIVSGDIQSVLQIKTDDIRSSQCVIFPGNSAYIGGDIVSGLYYCFEDVISEDITAFIDLGTNGEMALVTGNGLFAASSAAGPVFEGAGLSCGTGSLSGAIDHVFIDSSGRADCTTIGNAGRIAGICGSGALDIASGMYGTGLCDLHGTFREDEAFRVAEYSDGRPVLFTQEDMRQVQLGKAAIAAGFEILCRRAGVASRDITKVFLAGGMGYSLDVKSAVNIGLLPEELEGKIYPVGNTSLKGAVKLITEYGRGNEGEAERFLKNLARSIKTIDIAGDPDFQDIFISRIDFDKESEL